MKNPIRIAIIMEGGIVQAVLTDASQASIPLDVTIVDYDTEGVPDEELSAVRQDDKSFARAIVRKEPVQVRPEFIDGIDYAYSQNI